VVTAKEKGWEGVTSKWKGLKVDLKTATRLRKKQGGAAQEVFFRMAEETKIPQCPPVNQKSGPVGGWEGRGVERGPHYFKNGR